MVVVIGTPMAFEPVDTIATGMALGSPGGNAAVDTTADCDCGSGNGPPSPDCCGCRLPLSRCDCGSLCTDRRLGPDPAVPFAADDADDADADPDSDDDVVAGCAVDWSRAAMLPCGKADAPTGRSRDGAPSLVGVLPPSSLPPPSTEAALPVGVLPSLAFFDGWPALARRPLSADSLLSRAAVVDDGEVDDDDDDDVVAGPGTAAAALLPVAVDVVLVIPLGPAAADDGGRAPIITSVDVVRVSPLPGPAAEVALTPPLPLSPPILPRPLPSLLPPPLPLPSCSETAERRADVSDASCSDNAAVMDFRDDVDAGVEFAAPRVDEAGVLPAAPGTPAAGPTPKTPTPPAWAAPSSTAASALSEGKATAASGFVTLLASDRDGTAGARKRPANGLCTATGTGAPGAGGVAEDGAPNGCTRPAVNASRGLTTACVAGSDADCCGRMSGLCVDEGGGTAGVVGAAAPALSPPDERDPDTAPPVTSERGQAWESAAGSRTPAAAKDRDDVVDPVSFDGDT